MSVSVTMPRLGESVSEGTVTRWLKKEGERVEADEPLLEVSTDKVDTEIPSPAAGVLTSIKVSEDETVEVGSELAVIDDGAGDSESAATAVTAEEAPADTQADESAQTSREPEPEPEPEPGPEPGAAREQAGAAAGARESDTENREPQRTPEQSGAADGRSAASSQQREALATESGGEPAGEAPDDDEGANGPSYVTPLVRRLAAEHRVDLTGVHGTGVGGRIRKQDVLDAAGASGGGASAAAGANAAGALQPSDTPRSEPSRTVEAPASQTPAAKREPAPARSNVETNVRGKTEKLSRLRTVIATRLVESLQTSAQLTTVVEVDITRIVRVRERAKTEFEQREGVKLSFLPFFALATCEALREHPGMNASIDLEAGTATYYEAVHLGIAVDTPRGLLVPVIKDASDLNLAGLARKIADLAERTRGNHITPDELGGGTFTLTNTGSRGALFDTPIINQPQVGILGTGSVVKRPVVVDDPDVGEVIAVRHMVYLALTYDHRMVDGADAARFLTTIKTRLEEGEFEAEVGL
jgi:pyruvate dehydrogenase E2 component (dihydrolipoamide acetyltransferase)